MVSGVKSFSNDPVGNIKGMAIEKYNSLCGTVKDAFNGEWQSLANKAAYSLGGASVEVVEAAIAGAACSKIKNTVASKKVSIEKCKNNNAPKVKQPLSNQQLVQKAATLAEKRIGGTGKIAGTRKHTYAEKLLTRYQKIYGNRGLEIETTWLGGVKQKNVT